MTRAHLIEQAARRRPIVDRLRTEGHSTRAIAQTVGASQTTVRSDLHRLGADLPDRINGLDGKTYRYL